MTRGDVLRNIVESQAVADRFFNRAFVAMLYFGYLRRDPDAVGFQNWLDTINADPSNTRAHDLRLPVLNGVSPKVRTILSHKKAQKAQNII